MISIKTVVGLWLVHEAGERRQLLFYPLRGKTAVEQGGG